MKVREELVLKALEGPFDSLEDVCKATEGMRDSNKPVALVPRSPIWEMHGGEVEAGNKIIYIYIYIYI